MQDRDANQLLGNTAGRQLLAAFFIATFALSWSCFGAIAIVPSAWRGTRALLVLLAVFAPALLAVGLAAYDGGKARVTTLLRPLIRWRVGLGWYAFAVFYMPAIKLMVAGFYRIASGAWPRFGSDPWFALAIATILSTPVQAGEEIGWRGYALPSLAKRFGWARSAIVLGVIWAFWHLPVFFVQGADKYGQSFYIYLLQVTAVSVAITWLYFRTRGSLLLCMLMHSAINQSLGIVSSIDPTHRNPFASLGSPIGWLTVALLWIGGIYFILDMARHRPNQSPQPTAGRSDV
jgi:membrane protease YdiL (CAAX protease family)